MSILKVCTILGTRPEAIKLAPVIRLLNSTPDVEQQVLVTGQHNELLQQPLDLFGIRPTRDLKVMQENQQLAALTSRLLTEVEQDLSKYRPDWVLVQGDTTTAMAAALAAYYLRIPVAHVEAGLRTGDRFNPFPEEINRLFVDHLSQLHFAPTERARQNLLREGLEPSTIHVTGNTGIDALLEIASRDGVPLPTSIDEPGQPLLLVTAHRRENFGPALMNICQALRALVLRNPDVHVLYVLHPNPNVTGPVRKAIGHIPRLNFVAAVGYAQFTHLMKRSYLILTDSGGIQEEAPSLGKPVLVLRARTERVEAIEAGTAKLVGTNSNRIVEEAELLLRQPALYERMAHAPNPYGDGHAAERIVRILLKTAGDVHASRQGKRGLITRRVVRQQTSTSGADLEQNHE